MGSACVVFAPLRLPCNLPRGTPAVLVPVRQPTLAWRAASRAASRRIGWVELTRWIRVDFPANLPDTCPVLRAVVTLWFSITALLGPQVCCCSFANSSHAPAANGQTTSSTRPVKSCCQQESPPCGDNGKPNPQPDKPSKCPCERDKPAKTLPATGAASADLATQLELLNVFCAWLLASPTFDSPVATSASADTPPPVLKVAGRDLLAAYSLLRC